MRTGDDPVWGGLRASALCTPCRVFGAFRWASRQRVKQARYTPFASMLAIHPDASSFRRTPGKSLGIMSFSREAPGFSHGECHELTLHVHASALIEPRRPGQILRVHVQPHGTPA